MGGSVTIPQIDYQSQYRQMRAHRNEILSLPREANAEIDRHHRDLTCISEICTEVLDGDLIRIGSNAIRGLERIRNIVG
jgi:hypothetical protein